MNDRGTRNQGCFISVVIVLALGATLLYLDYILIATHLTPSFCSRPECEAMRKFLDVSAIGSVVVLTCAVLNTLNVGLKWLPLLAVGAMLVSVVTGFFTGVGIWGLPNAAFTFIVTWLLLLLVADQ